MKRPDIDAVIAAAFADTGVRLGVDDPVVAVLVAQQRSLAAFEEQRRQDAAQSAESIQAAFAAMLAEFDKKAAPVIAAAEMFQKQREKLLAEILAHNKAELEGAEAKMFASIAHRIRKENDAAAERFYGGLKTLLVTGIGIALAIQAVLTAVIVLLMR